MQYTTFSEVMCITWVTNDTLISGGQISLLIHDNFSYVKCRASFPYRAKIAHENARDYERTGNLVYS